MAKKNVALIVGTVVVVAVATTAILYGNGQLNFGAFNMAPEKKVARVAMVECAADALKQDNFCIYSFEPLEYYVIKDGSGFMIYGPTVTEKYNGHGTWNLKDGDTYNAGAYSVTKGTFTPFTTTFKLRDRDSEKVPSFSFDYEAAKNIQGSRFVEINLPNSVKLRFNTFNIPDKNLNNR